MAGPLKHVELVRFVDDGQATLGRLCVHRTMASRGDVSTWGLYTVERPWLGNEPRVSCIPDGAYRLVLGRFNRGGYPTYVVEDVENRTHIKFHRANWATDVLGCIGIGTSAGTMNAHLAVRDSRLGFSRFMVAMQDVPEAILTVRHYR